MNEPTVMCEGLAYEEGADLDPEEVAENARLLPLPLEQLPGGGIRHGSIVSVSDQAQDFNCQLVISHKVVFYPPSPLPWCSLSTPRSSHARYLRRA